MSKRELVAGAITHSKKFGNWKQFQVELGKLLQKECSGGFDVKADGFSLSFLGFHDLGESLLGDHALTMNKNDPEPILRPVSADEHGRVLAENIKLKADLLAVLAADQEQRAALAGRAIFESSFDDWKPK